ncbi:MAG TPA: GyrI-like domain-containing protein [Thermoplasmata archaeon]|nr:GyrI-like domain-containing protein [Thermoplasmata archaeon]
MVVDFVLKASPRYRVACLSRQGPWKPDNLRAEFRQLVAWAAKGRIRTGHWIFVSGPSDRWTACLEVFGTAPRHGGIRMRTLPKATVASVTFDPEAISARVIYHGLRDWLHWRKVEKKIRSVASSREVYTGDPWKDPKAWAHCEVQFVVRK